MIVEGKQDQARVVRQCRQCLVTPYWVLDQDQREVALADRDPLLPAKCCFELFYPGFHGGRWEAEGERGGCRGRQVVDVVQAGQWRVERQLEIWAAERDAVSAFLAHLVELHR